MKTQFKTKVVLTGSHLISLLLGFVLGLYLLPILVAPKSNSLDDIELSEKESLFQVQFVRDLDGSDFLHWGDAKVSISKTQIIINGSLAPGPDYKLYLINEFVENEEQFLKIKGTATFVNDIKSFENFIVDVPPNVDVTKHSSIVVWCEAFNEFITSAQYQ
jgi:hypothetical protein